MVHSTNLRVVYREKCYCAFQEKTAQRRIDEVSLETDGSTKEHIHLELNSKFHISRNTNNVVLGNHAVTVIPSDTDLVETSWKIFMLYIYYYYLDHYKKKTHYSSTNYTYS